ncbi:MAG: DUF2304 domain-containing protein [Clostridia bacterium]|nr:DUF2304 domain-containing protein [Clostridia bacterium]
MISLRMQVFSIVAVVLFLVSLVALLRKNRLELKYSLLWLLSGLVMLLLAFFPGLLDRFAQFIGVYSSVNALFAVLIFCGVLVMISLTSIVSKEKREIVRLTQEMGMMENRLRELEKTLEELKEAKEGV